MIQDQHSNSPEQDDITRETTPELDDIKIRTHPHSLKEVQVYSFIQYSVIVNKHESDDLSSFADSIDRRPWRPFRTRLDFETAEVMLEAHMTAALRERNISCIIKAKGDAPASQFTVKDQIEMDKIWAQARDTRASSVSFTSGLHGNIDH